MIRSSALFHGNYNIYWSAFSFSNEVQLRIYFFLEITSIEIYSDQKNNRYFIGEDVTITAKFGNPFAVLCVSWQFNANGSSSTINTSLPKYAGTRYENNKHLLIIGSCCQSDAGEYSLVATCKENVDICSAKLQLKVVEGKYIHLMQ